MNAGTCALQMRNRLPFIVTIADRCKNFMYSFETEHLRKSIEYCTETWIERLDFGDNKFSTEIKLSKDQPTHIITYKNTNVLIKILVRKEGYILYEHVEYEEELPTKYISNTGEVILSNWYYEHFNNKTAEITITEIKEK